MPNTPFKQISKHPKLHIMLNFHSSIYS